MPPTSLTLVTSSEPDPVPADIRAIIDLFATHLAKVTFPDVDAGSLRKQAEDVRAEAKAIAKARDVLAAAIAATDARLASLTQATERAMAYARIYADAHPDRQAIRDAVAALERPVEAPVASVKRRGRPPKQREERVERAELFDSAQTEAQ